MARFYYGIEGGSLVQPSVGVFGFGKARTLRRLGACGSVSLLKCTSFVRFRVHGDLGEVNLEMGLPMPVG